MRIARFCSIAGMMLAALLAIPTPGLAVGKKLRVFVLAGQSNMEGHATIETFDYLSDDPIGAALLAKMRASDGRVVVRDDVWISYFTGSGDDEGEGFGKLTAGYGARRVPNESAGKIGPEFTFGITMGDALAEPVLLIKTAWGGKSLNYDFRPPGAGPFPRSATDIAKNRNPVEGAGRYYRAMIQHVRAVLEDPGRVCPEFDPSAGWELSGFIWFQGWNDLVDREFYPMLPAANARERFAPYSELLGHFIRDVRRDLSAPALPFVIGVLGVDGVSASAEILEFREAMAAPASFPEFRGNVAAVPTAPFWASELAAIDAKRAKVRTMRQLLERRDKNQANADGTMTPAEIQERVRAYETELISSAEAALWKRGASNAGYHYLGCARTFALMGEAFAKANLALLSPPPGPHP